MLDYREIFRSAGLYSTRTPQLPTGGAAGKDKVLGKNPITSHSKGSRPMAN
jgi:hypothetical protein